MADGGAYALQRTEDVRPVADEAAAAAPSDVYDTHSEPTAEERAFLELAAAAAQQRAAESKSYDTSVESGEEGGAAAAAAAAVARDTAPAPLEQAQNPYDTAPESGYENEPGLAGVAANKTAEPPSAGIHLRRAAPDEDGKEASASEYVQTVDSLVAETSATAKRGEIDALPRTQWAERWRHVRRVKIASIEDQALVDELMNELERDFETEVRRTVQVLITELSPPVAARSIKPVSVGGIAGGTKFIHNNVIYKVAVDDRKLYGGDEFAMKAASMEFLGTNAVRNSNCFLGTALTFLVDWLGFRVTAASVLPISAATLVYGSSDGGRTVHDESERARTVARQLAVFLNLKPHRVGDKELTLPGDMEIHETPDGDLFALDPARLFPPEAPSGIRNGILYRLLRPELVRTSPRPLSSDAFSNFGAHNAAEHNGEVRAATALLMRSAIPSLAARLEARAASRPAGGSLAEDHASASWLDEREDDVVASEHAAAAAQPVALSDALAVELHEAGVNVRYLGVLRAHVKHPALRQSLLEEMACRCLKTRLRAELRAMVHRDRAGAQHESFQARLADTVVRWLSSVFGAEPGAAALWAISDAQLGPAGGGGGGAQMEESIAATLIRKFRGGLAQAERQARVDLRSLIDRGRVFRRLLTCCMIDLSPEALERVCASIPWPADKALRADDLLGVRPRLRSVSEIAVSAADNAMNQALAAKDIESARRWASLARAKYREALALNPNSTIAVMNLGALFFYVLRDIPAALRCFERAIELNPLDANAHDNLAMVHRFGTRNHALAKASYEKALEINPKHLNNMLQFLTFLITELKGMTHPLVREFEQTDRFVLESSGYRGMGTVAIFYQYVKKDLDKAEHFYREAVRQSRGDPQVCCNLALFLYKERKNFEEARQVLEQVMRSRPGFEAAVTAYCDLLASLGATDREKAVSIAGDFLLSAKLHHSQAALLAASLSSLGQGQRAMALLEDSLTRAPWSAELLDQLAQVTLSTTQDAKQA